MKEPSRKQRQLAQKISDSLKIDMPKKETAYSYWHFINKNIDEYKNQCRKDFYDTYGEDISECYCESWFC